MKIIIDKEIIKELKENWGQDKALKNQLMTH